MAQVPLAPPPPTGGPLDRWLYLLWRRLTQEAQILWSSILPGTSADVAAVVTDETGTAGNLVFSGNPTLQGLNVEDAAFTSRGITDNATATAVLLETDGKVKIGTSNTPSNKDTVNPWMVLSGSGITGSMQIVRHTSVGVGGALMKLSATRGTDVNSYTILQANDGIGTFSFAGADGNEFLVGAEIRVQVDGTPADNSLPSKMIFGTTETGRTSPTERMRIDAAGNITLGGTSTAPALKVIPASSQARWVEVTGATSSGNPQVATSAGELLLPQNIVLPKTSGKGIQVDTASPSFGWRDLLGPIEIKAIGATDPVWSLYRGSMYAYTFDTATAEAFFVFHLPHDMLPSSASMLIHAHWSQIVVDTGGTAGVPGVAEWNFDISYADGHGTAGGAADPFTAPATFTVTQQASTTQYGHMIAEVEFANNGGTGGKLNTATMVVDGLVLVRMYRTKGNPADTLDQAPFVHTVDIHYQSTNVGTKQNNPITTGSFYT